MTKGLTRKQTNIPALKNENNEIKYFSPEDKAYAFGMHFANTFTPHENESEEAKLFTTETDRMVSYLNNLEITDPKYKATPFEIKSYIKRTKNNKAPGPDKITNCMLKHLPSIAISHISKILNACFSLNYFPTEWKKATILVFAKPGNDLTMTTSYRPISLLNTMS